MSFYSPAPTCPGLLPRPGVMPVAPTHPGFPPKLSSSAHPYLSTLACCTGALRSALFWDFPFLPKSILFAEVWRTKWWKRGV